MIQLIKLEATKTYASEQNAIKAVEKAFGGRATAKVLQYIIIKTEEGRYFPAFLGERAIQEGVHFHFHVIG